MNANPMTVAFIALCAELALRKYKATVIGWAFRTLLHDVVVSTEDEK